VQEAIRLLNCHSGAIYVDGTIGDGGHAYQIFRSCPDIRLLIGIDRDSEALDKAIEKLSPFKGRFSLVQRNYSDIKSILSHLRIKDVDGVLLDLGISTYQLLSPSRGFSFSMNGPLDMRMDRAQTKTAGDLVNTLPARELEKIIWEYGEEKYFAQIAQAIVRKRLKGSVRTTSELASLVTNAIPFHGRPRKIHPATRTFQALRIAVNDELDHLEKGLREFIDVLAPGGRLAVICFHSLEDRIVKTIFRHYSRPCICPPMTERCRCEHVQKLTVLTKKPIAPTLEEIRQNPRSRSARLRGAEKS
jgi:16S rRNA (cytosine1402-N4)-methyltransferase